MNLKLKIKQSLSSLLSTLNKFSIFSEVIDFIFDYSLTRSQTVTHNGVKLTLCRPNGLINYRIRTFSQKEPETLDWIDKLNENDILWDIGSNIGLYTCYAAAKSIHVVSFEPSYLNIHSLVTNSVLNNISDYVTIVPLPLSDKVQLSKFNSRFTRVGSALSSFSNTVGYDGNCFVPSTNYFVPGLTIDSIIEIFGLPLPTAIKIDVDGLEHLILKGGENALKTVRTILIEVNDNFSEQRDSVSHSLEMAGFHLMYKEHSQMIADSKLFDMTFNQIWSK